ncbi:MAG: tRNA (N6-isopentenyl adenosine(37)-C2)-methylthiotransferase MiaB [Alphaproteobacteria bacterium]|nr:tRNA (N6-isopentenyl adenosine(37)-C2)-methylthiotransferase MiaB [Alphaproteobacteria bacterium]
MSKRFFIKTWGCQMNVYDSGRIADVLVAEGYERAADLAQADVLILNTCHIREKASEKLFSELGRMRLLQQKRAALGEKLILGVAGCVAQALCAEIAARAPYVAMIFGPQTYHRLPQMLAQIESQTQSVMDVEFPIQPKFDFLPHAQGQRGCAGFMAVQEGCDRFCSYCVVPYTRGAAYARPVSALLDEAKLLVDQGVRDLTLLGQEVNAYKDEASGKGLAGLIEALALIKNLLRIRYTSSHPLGMDEALMVAHRDIPTLMNFVHLPVQSGADCVLKAMNRHHTARDYRDLVEKMRGFCPDLALSSDFIVGFPSESDQDFEDTLALVRDVGFAQAFSFKYSARPGTPAALMGGQIPEEIKETRLQTLQKLLRAQQTSFNKDCLKKEMSVLIEGPSRREGFLFGRTVYMQTAYVKGDPSLIGAEVTARVIKASPNSLEVEVVS